MCDSVVPLGHKSAVAQHGEHLQGGAELCLSAEVAELFVEQVCLWLM